MFNPGDKVKCIKQSDFSKKNEDTYGKLGEIYIVSSFKDNNFRGGELKLEGMKGKVLGDRFILVMESRGEEKQEIKVNKKVDSGWGF